MPEELEIASVTTDSAPVGGGEGTALAVSEPAVPSDGQGDTAQGTEAPAWQGIVEAIPQTDDDLNQPNFPHVEGLRTQRQQLRVLSDAIKELQQGAAELPAYRELGAVETIKPAVEFLNLLYTPLTDPRTGEQVVDQATGTAYITTVPALEYLDENSPGMPEQLLTDLLNFQPTDENGNKTEKLSRQVLRFWGLDPDRINEYRNIDTLLVGNGQITAEELGEIPAEYHDAYRNLPPSVREVWSAYTDADKTIMLKREKDALDRVVKDRERDAKEREREEAATRAYLMQVREQQEKYFDKVRRERFASIADSLSQQVTFSADASTNAVMHGAVGTVLANLIDPDLRFISEGLLSALGVKLDHTFDEALELFNVNARDLVAQEMAGDKVQAKQSLERANAAANVLTTKLGVIALKVAKAMGGQQKAAAERQGQALSAAATSRPVAGSSTAPNGQQPAGILPPGIRPGTPEAARWLAESTGFFRS